MLVRLRRRDPESVGTLYDRYGKAAFNLALRILGNAEIAEDVVAEAVIKCWNRVLSFRETRDSAVGVWLLMTTYATALDYLQGPRSASGEASIQPDLLERGVILQDWSKSLDADRVQQSYAALQSLSLEEKQVLELAFFEALEPDQVADRLGRTSSELDALVRSALRKLTAWNAE